MGVSTNNKRTLQEFRYIKIPDRRLISGLLYINVVNHEDNACDIDLVFTGKQVHPGTINEAVGSGSLWTKALAKGANILGSIDHDVGDVQVDLINSLMYTGLDTGAISGSPLPIFLQAEENSTSVYFFGVDRTGSLTFEDGDFEFIFHIEY